jgi:Ice-binding-like/PEP-CTERM motif
MRNHEQGKQTMKTIYLLTAARLGAKRIAKALVLAVAVMFLHQQATAATVDLGAASSFAVLGGAGITITGPTTITGDVGTFPTTSITGLENLTLNGVNHGGDAVTQNAKNDLVTAYNSAATRPFDTTYGAGFDLVGLTLTSGVYHDATSLFLSGTLTLDAQGNPDAIWIFQAGTTFIAGSDSTVALIGGAQACNVFWQVGSSVTLGTGADFAGNILALESVTLNTGASVDGRVFARNGTVTMDNNNAVAACLAVPEPGSMVLLGSGLAILFAFRRRFFCQG